MMESRGPTIRMLAVSIAALALSCGAAFGARAHLVSSKPIYAKVAVNQSGTKVLALALDESKGTGKGYDRIYADKNFDGAFDEGERISARTQSGKGYAFCFSGRFAIGAPFNPRADSTSMASVTYICIASRGRQPEQQHLGLVLKTDIRSGGANWSYAIVANLKPSTSLASAPVAKLSGQPKLQVDAKPDPKKPGNTGIGLSLAMGKASLIATTGRGMTPATIVIRDSRSQIVKEDKGGIDKFAFG